MFNALTALACIVVGLFWLALILSGLITYLVP